MAILFKYIAFITSLSCLIYGCQAYRPENIPTFGRDPSGASGNGERTRIDPNLRKIFSEGPAAVFPVLVTFFDHPDLAPASDSSFLYEYFLRSTAFTKYFFEGLSHGQPGASSLFTTNFLSGQFSNKDYMNMFLAPISVDHFSSSPFSRIVKGFWILETMKEKSDDYIVNQHTLHSHIAYHVPMFRQS